MSRRLAREEGIFNGGSTGSVLFVALQVAKNLTENDVVVFTVCDTGERYLSKHHNDEWMREKRLLEMDKTTIGIVCETKISGGLPKLISITPDEKLSDALNKLEEYNISFLPVFENGKSTGVIDETKIMSELILNPNIVNKKVKDVMDKPLPILDEQDDVRNAIKALKKSPAILVSEYGKIIGILTRFDVLDFI
jgi:cystathionine beta-synthase